MIEEVEEDNNTTMRKVALDASYLIHVTPRIGMLAPRGKNSSTNDVDVDFFSDRTTIQVRAEQIQKQQVSASSTTLSTTSLWLLVGTEAEKWIYKINVTI